MAEKRLRLAGINVQPIFMWDDGSDELTPGPAMQAQQLPASKLAEFADEILDKMVEFEEQALQQEAEAQANAPQPNRASRRQAKPKPRPKPKPRTPLAAVPK